MVLIDHIYAVIPLLGLLIFVHELGHFMFAKLFGVRVLKFSLGFGPPIGVGRFRMRWERNGTEYVIAWFPLGGFVKMLGEQLLDSEEDEAPPIDAHPEEYLNAKPIWQRLLITFAGPAMNLFLPVVIFMGIMWVGVPRPLAVVGVVEPGSPAASGGVAVGDRLISVNGVAVQWWDQAELVIRNRTSGSIDLELIRDDEPLSLALPLTARSSLDGFGDVEEVGWIGIGHRRLPALVGVPDGTSVAASAGLRSGDRVVRVGKVEVESWEELRQAYETHSGEGAVSLSIERAEGEESIAVTVPALDRLEELGVVAASILIDSVKEGLPADRAGLQRGDLILTVGGRPAGSFRSFRQTVLSGQGAAIELGYARDGVLYSAIMRPEETSVPSPLGIEGMEEKHYLIGITHALSTLPGELLVDRQRNPLTAFPRAVDQTLDMTALFLTGLGKIFTGEVGTDKLSGPIGIAEVVRKSLDLGWEYYFRIMIFISINLGILNLLPIPVLDGGQAVLLIIEGVRRSPVSMRTREIVQSVGLTMLVMLMGLAFWNDLSRHWAKFVQWLGGTGL